MRPIQITSEWLKNLGGIDVTRAYSRPCFAFVPEDDEPHPIYIFYVECYGDEWTLTYYGNIIATLNGVHHLQQLVFALESVWLTLKAETA
ncbi:hypothetical protein [Spirosoma daeguense]